MQFDATGDETSGGDARCWMPHGDTSGGCFSSAEVNVTADSKVTADSFDDSVSVETVLTSSFGADFDRISLTIVVLEIVFETTLVWSL